MKKIPNQPKLPRPSNWLKDPRPRPCPPSRVLENWKHSTLVLAAQDAQGLQGEPTFHMGNGWVGLYRTLDLCAVKSSGRSEIQQGLQYPMLQAWNTYPNFTISSCLYSIYGTYGCIGPLWNQKIKWMKPSFKLRDDGWWLKRSKTGITSRRQTTLVGGVSQLNQRIEKKWASQIRVFSRILSNPIKGMQNMCAIKHDKTWFDKTNQVECHLSSWLGVWLALNA